MYAGSNQTALIANAIKASGVVVRVERTDFLQILHRAEAPLVVHAAGGVFSSKHKYLTSYKGLVFYAKLKRPLDLPAGVEVVEAERVAVPEL